MNCTSSSEAVEVHSKHSFTCMEDHRIGSSVSLGERYCVCPDCVQVTQDLSLVVGMLSVLLLKRIL